VRTDNEGQFFDINTTSSNISADEEPRFTRFEHLQVLFSLLKYSL
jgi:hypothetical protein